MRLEVFDFIDQVLARMDELRGDIEDKSEEIKGYFKDVLKDEESLTGISKRIKSEESLSEKILRGNYYLKYKTVDNVLANMSDIIGLRIQCRFIKNEAEIFSVINNFFSLESIDHPGYYYNMKNDRILLKLDGDQPQTQHNGFHIYRVDGMYLADEINYNFELQIKSSVNTFWGDIEHDILYKNFSYMITEDFLREMLYSIKRNLEQVDAQMLVIYEYLTRLEEEKDEADIRQMKRVISKFIHDIFSVGFKESTGVLLDFRGSADLIVDYLFAKAYYNGREEGLAFYLSKLVKKLTGVKLEDFEFGSFLSLDNTGELSSAHSKLLGSGIESIMNVDLKWNLILSILFELSDENKNIEFANFIDYLVFKICYSIDQVLEDYKMDEGTRDSIKDKLVEVTINFICEYYDSDLFSDYNMQVIERSSRAILDASAISNTAGEKEILYDNLAYDDFYKEIQREAEF